MMRHGTCETRQFIASHYRTDNLNGRIDGTSKIDISSFTMRRFKNLMQ